ncbi:MAG: sensor histidine kinase, partial [Cardiobacterium sp.]
IDLDLETRTDATILIVEDNGPGIAPDERARVLDPFYRQLGSDEEGTGLGLAIVKTLCDKYGAILTLRDALSHPHGLRVEIRFPRQIP